MAVTLITGANKGLGYETARQLIKAGHTVYIGARDPGRAGTRLPVSCMPVLSVST
jgi:NAD(P)-dependent dehydrogenase (short-subunit alcohol dehydrogenase family)